MMARRKLTEAEKWDRKAQRWNRREADRYPLLGHAGLTRAVTGPELKDRKAAIMEAVDEFYRDKAKYDEHATLFYFGLCEERLPQPVVAKLTEIQWRWGPPRHRENRTFTEYSVSFWRAVYDHLTAPELPSAGPGERHLAQAHAELEAGHRVFLPALRVRDAAFVKESADVYC
jgi:hypothetical protein